MLLSIETSTTVCSVSLSTRQGIVAHETLTGANHASQLTPLIERLMSGRRWSDVEAVGVGDGPGSYTGLRIGAASAKGIAYALGVPLVAVPTLETLAAGIFAADRECQVAAPVIDARRLEVYALLFERGGRLLKPVEAVVLDHDSFGTALANNIVAFGGDGAPKCKGLITSPNARFLDSIRPDARLMAPLAYQRLDQGLTADVAYYEPFYLKEYRPANPANKVLGRIQQSKQQQ